MQDLHTGRPCEGFVGISEREIETGVPLSCHGKSPRTRHSPRVDMNMAKNRESASNAHLKWLEIP
jgi:uncharacterized Zn-finger protein